MFKISCPFSKPKTTNPQPLPPTKAQDNHKRVALTAASVFALAIGTFLIVRQVRKGPTATNNNSTSIQQGPQFPSQISDPSYNNRTEQTHVADKPIDPSEAVFPTSISQTETPRVLQQNFSVTPTSSNTETPNDSSTGRSSTWVQIPTTEDPVDQGTDH